MKTVCFNFRYLKDLLLRNKNSAEQTYTSPKRRKKKKYLPLAKINLLDYDKNLSRQTVVELTVPIDIDAQLDLLKRELNRFVEREVDVNLDKIIRFNLLELKENGLQILLNCFCNKVVKNISVNYRKTTYSSVIKNHYEGIQRSFFCDFEISDNVILDTIATNDRVFTVHVRAPFPHHQTVINNKNFMYYNLFAYTSVTKQLNESWNNCCHDVLRNLFTKFEDYLSHPLSCTQLQEFVIKFSSESRNFLLQKWLPEYANILQINEEFSIILTKPSASVEKFFRCIYSLMSNQLRQFIFQLLFRVMHFIKSYQVETNSYENSAKSFKLIKNPFLIVELKYSSEMPYYTVDPDFKKMYSILGNIYVKLMSISEEIPRIEFYLFKKDAKVNGSKHLTSVRITDGYVQDIFKHLFDCCWLNAADPPAYVKNYECLVKLLECDVKKRIDKFLANDNISSLQDCFSLVNEYQDLRRKVMFFQRNIALNMISLDCSDMNKALLDKVNDYEYKVISHVVHNYQDLNTQIIRKYEEIARNVSQIPDDSQSLVDLCNYITKCKSVLLLNLQKKLVLSSEYICFVMDYADLTEEQIILNSRTFCWPRELSTILKSASLAIAKKKEVAENILKGEVRKFNARTEEHIKELEILRRKDPPLLTINELKETVGRMDSFMKRLKDDIRVAEEIQKEEELLNIETAYNKEIFNMLNSLQPYSELWHTALSLYEYYEVWYNGPYMELNLNEIIKLLQDMQTVLSKLLDVFSDSLRTKRILNIVFTKLQNFQRYIPVLELLCNPGLRQRHWKKISDLKGYNIVDTDIKSLANFVELDIDSYFDELKNLNDVVTKEYELELNLVDIKRKWNDVKINYSTDRNGKINYLSEIDSVQQILDDHLLRVQVMRASAYVAPIESDVEMWEDKLILIQDILDHLTIVQESVMYLKPLFVSTVDEIGEQLCKFNDVCDIWSNILEHIMKDSHILALTEYSNMIDDLKYCSTVLDEVKKKENEYLDKKRKSFPRFFFLSNRELMEILSKGISQVQTHLKCFPGIHSLELTKDMCIHGVSSEIGETVELITSLNLDDNAAGRPEFWLKQLHEIIMCTLKELMNKAFDDYRVNEPSWLLRWPEMIVQCITYLKLTSQIEASMENSSLAELKVQYEEYTNCLTDTMSHGTEMNRRSRRVFSNIILLLTHAREVIAFLDAMNCKINDFNWTSQLKTYKDNSQIIVFNVLNSSLPFGYEYSGNSLRSVVTPLTEKYYRFILITVDQFAGISLYGKYGSGKTSLCRDISYMLGKPFFTVNCVRNFVPTTIEMFIKGIAQTGIWCCFQELDRMNHKELSAFIEAVNSLYKQAANKISIFQYDHEEFPLNPNFAVFITLSEKYGKEFPVALRSTFHLLPVTEPDLAVITKSSLLSFGIRDYTALLEKLRFFLQKSADCSASFGEYTISNMKIIKRIMLASEQFKEEYPNLSDNEVVLKAVNYVCSKSLFAEKTLDSCKIAAETSLNNLLHKSLNEFVQSRGLLATDEFVEKVGQLHQLLSTWRGVIIVGNSLSGKTETIKCLMDYTLKSNNDLIPRKKIRQRTIYPASMTVEQLYGSLSVNYQWNDGVLTQLLRETGDEEEKWIIFDGPMENRWTEGITSMIDEEGKLCLISGELIHIKAKMRFIFETDRLQDVSPAFLYRCSVLHLKSDHINWKILLFTFMNYLHSKYSSEQCFVFKEIISWLIPAILEFLDTKCKTEIKISKNGLFLNFTRLVKCIVENNDSATNINIVDMQCIIIFSLLWAYAGNITEASKKSFNAYFRALLLGNVDKYPKPSKFKLTRLQLFPEKDIVFDWKYEIKQNSTWIPWMNMNGKENSLNIEESSNGLFIPTAESTRQLYFLKLMLHFQLPVLLFGDSDTGKTALIQTYMSTLLPDKYVTNQINISACPDVCYVSEIILSKINRRRKGVYGPDIGKTYIAFIDDIGAFGQPKKKQILFEFLRQVFTEKYLYDSGNYSKINFADTLFVGSLSGTTRSSSDVLSRFASCVNIIYLHSLEENTLVNIFTDIVYHHFSSGFTEQILNLSNNIVAATIGIYQRIKKEFAPSADSPHYIFSLHDINYVINGIRLMPSEKCQSVDEMLRLWVHEIMRTFSDRCTADQDKERLLEVIKWSSYKYLRQNINEYLGHLISDDCKQINIEHLRNLLFTNFLNRTNGNYAYDEVTDVEFLMNFMCENMNTFSEMYSSQFRMVPFRYIAEHVCHIIRGFYIGCGHVVVVGPEGSGRKTTVKLASAIVNFKVFQIKVDSNYSMKHWSEDLKSVLLEAAFYDKTLVFLITDDQIRHNVCMDDLNILLNTADLAYLFTLEEKSDIYDKMVEIARERNIKMEMSPSVLYNLFVKRIKQNLHIAFIMSSVDSDVLKEKFEKYPSLIKCAVIDRFEQWPEEALIDIAGAYLKSQFSTKDKDKCASIFSKMHQRTIELSKTLCGEGRVNLFVSCDTFLKFTFTFQKLFEETLAKITTLKFRHESGLKILEFAADQVAAMQNKLKVLKPNLMATSDAMEKLMIKIEQNTIAIEASKEIVAADEALANESAASSQAIRDDCESDLSEAEPALQNAIEALNTLKPADVNIIKSMKNPPDIVKLILESVCVMKGLKPEYRINTLDDTITEDYWPVSLKLLGDNKFLENLKNFNRDHIDPAIMKTIRERYIQHLNFNPEIVKNVSNACEGLCNWVRALEVYDRVIKIVKPKQLKLAEAEADYTIQMERLNEKRSQLTEVMEKLQSLRDELAEKTKSKKELEDSINDCLKKLERAEKLINDLASEKLRWLEAKKRLEKTAKNAVGDIALSAAVIVYLGSLSSDIKQIYVNNWKSLFYDHKLPVSEEFSMSATFYELDDYYFASLCDQLVDGDSIENAIIAEKCHFFPIFIDPHGVGEQFLRTIKGDLCTDLPDDSAKRIQIIKDSAESGRSVLLKNFSEYDYEDICDIVLNKIIQRNNKKYILFEDVVIVAHKNFKIFLISSQYNPQFSLKLINKVTVINFTLTRTGVEQQLLKTIIKKDSPILDENKHSCMSEWLNSSKVLTEAEDKILNIVCTEENVLDDETVINTLSSLKILLEEIEEKRKLLSEAEGRVEGAQVDMRDVCKCTTNVYYCVSQIAKQTPDYYFPLAMFCTILNQSIEKSEMSKSSKKKYAIVKYFLRDSFQQARCDIYDFDKVLLSSLLSFQLVKAKSLLYD